VDKEGLADCTAPLPPILVVIEWRCELEYLGLMRFERMLLLVLVLMERREGRDVVAVKACLEV